MPPGPVEGREMAAARSPLEDLASRVAGGHFGSPLASDAYFNMPPSSSIGLLGAAGLEDDDFFGGRDEEDIYDRVYEANGHGEDSPVRKAGSPPTNGHAHVLSNASSRTSLRNLPRLDTSMSISSQTIPFPVREPGMSSMQSKESLHSVATGIVQPSSDTTRVSSPAPQDNDAQSSDEASRERTTSVGDSLSPPRQRRSSFYDENGRANGHSRMTSFARTESSSPDPWRRTSAISRHYATSMSGISQLDLGPPAPLLDQSHLKPGSMASLLSSEKTLELYRVNVKKTNDPDVAYEFAVFLMDVARDQTSGFSPAASSASGATSSTDASSAPLSGVSDGSNYSRNIGKKLGKDKGQAQDPLSAISAGPNSALDDVTKALSNHSYMLEAIQILKKIADRGHVAAQALLGDTYARGIGTGKGKPDFDKAFQLFVLAGKHGNPHACYRVGQCCENGWGCRKDNTKAIIWYNKSASQQYAAAMYRLGIAGLNSELGWTKKQKEGFKWLKRAAELAHSQPEHCTIQALHQLALLHEKGVEHVIFVDYEYAAELLAKASELGHTQSAYKLGECYEYGKMGCPQDSALSIHYYNIAAQQGHREACFALTAWYLVGSPGVLPQSDTEAYLWAKKAAEQGLAKAEYAVGYFTEVGVGRHKDPREAMSWFRKAADHGDQRAVARLKANAQQALQIQREEAAHQARLKREAQQREAAIKRRKQEQEMAEAKERAAKEARIARDRERAERAEREALREAARAAAREAERAAREAQQQAERIRRESERAMREAERMERMRREQIRRTPGARAEEYFGQSGRHAPLPGVASYPALASPLPPSPSRRSLPPGAAPGPTSPRSYSGTGLNAFPLSPVSNRSSPQLPKSPSSNKSSPFLPALPFELPPGAGSPRSRTSSGFASPPASVDVSTGPRTRSRSSSLAKGPAPGYLSSTGVDLSPRR